MLARFLAWLTQPETIAAASYVAANVVNGLVRTHHVSRLPPLARAAVETLGRALVTTHHDAEGTFKLPGRRAGGLKQTL